MNFLADLLEPYSSEWTILSNFFFFLHIIIIIIIILLLLLLLLYCIMSCCIYICKPVRSCHRSILKDKILLVNMVHFHLSLSGCSMGSLETCTHVIPMPESHIVTTRKISFIQMLPPPIKIRTKM